MTNAPSRHAETISPAAPAADDPKRRFVFFAGTAFDSVVSGRARRLAEELARRGNPVTFVELPTLRVSLTPPFRFGPRTLAKTPLQIIRLCPLPGYVRLHATTLAYRWQTYAARRLATWIPDLAESIFVVPTPRWVPVVALLPAALKCYDYIDHVQVQAGPKGGSVFTEWDDQLLRCSDLVTAVSEPVLRDVSARFDPERVFLIPNGVPGEWVGALPRPVARDRLTDRPGRTIAGFLGSLFEWIDLDLLANAARTLPDVEFVLVGPTRRGVRLQALQALDNVKLLPPVPFADVPKVIQAFDVCLIPFRQDAIAEYADPLKVYEYCALGKPVISTVAFGVHGHPAPITVAQDAEAFAAAIRDAFEADSAEAKEQRIAFAADHTWHKRVGELLAATAKLTGRTVSGRP
ncbi:MAG: glycosyltransferase [Phycisphaerae bacterium]|nr:glycosyltransferase [Phycisphaerae bacterium]